MDTIKWVITDSVSLTWAFHQLIRSERNTVNQGLETLQGTSAEAKKEGNKGINPSVTEVALQLTAWTGIAKDSNVGIGDRATAAKDALGNKVDETKHDVSAIFLLIHTFMCLSHSNCLPRNRQSPRVTSSPSKRLYLTAMWSSSWPKYAWDRSDGSEAWIFFCRTSMGR